MKFSRKMLGNGSFEIDNPSAGTRRRPFVEFGALSVLLFFSYARDIMYTAGPRAKFELSNYV